LDKEKKKEKKDKKMLGKRKKPNASDDKNLNDFFGDNNFEVVP
jgi:hypothetical protein